MMINVAATVASTRALGPGRRAVVWVQGCPFDCAGCVAPDWIPDRPARQVEARVLVDELVDDTVDGLTFSGGEPMAQAAGLTEVARLARHRRPGLSLVCFTGHRLERLRSHPSPPGVADLLAEVDVLIDGRYVESLNDNRGLRGSSNQRIHHLTDRLRDAGFDFEGERRAEVHLDGGELTVVGVPPRGLLPALGTALEAARAHLAGNRATDPGATSDDAGALACPPPGSGATRSDPDGPVRPATQLGGCR